MDNSQYKSTKVLYLPERDMFSGVIVLTNEQGNNFHRSWHTHFWVWWANTGKTISVKKHMYNTYAIQRFINQKLANKYQEVDEQYLLELWPEFYDKLDCRMLFEVLKND